MKSENNNFKKQRSTLLIRELLLTEGPQSQASISRKTGLSPAMVNYVVKQLIEVGAADIHWLNGREGMVLLTSKRGQFISLLINVDKISGSLFLFESEVKIDFEFKITQDAPQRNNPDTVISLLFDVLKNSNLSVSDISGLAVSIVAPLDIENETIISWSAGRLPGWCDIKIKSFFEQKLGVTVVVGNDANHSTLAEWTWGVGRGIENFVYIACSKQIGGGIIINNHLYKGSNGMAAEFGHLIIDNVGPVCFCGCQGCLTTFISEHAIIMSLSRSESYKHSLLEIISAAREGDVACQCVLSEAGKYLGKALANITKILAPGMVAIGGDLSGAGPLFFDSVIATIDEHNLGTVSKAIEFKTAKLIHQPEILGGLAALLAEKNQGISDLPDWIK